MAIMREKIKTEIIWEKVGVVSIEERNTKDYQKKN